MAFDVHLKDAYLSKEIGPSAMKGRGIDAVQQTQDDLKKDLSKEHPKVKMRPTLLARSES